MGLGKWANISVFRFMFKCDQMDFSKFSDSENLSDSGSMIFQHWCHYFVTLWCCDFSISGAVRWNSVEIEFQNPSLAARPRPSASLIISVNLLIKMSCKRFPSFHSDHYQHARPPAEYRSFSPLPALHTFQRSSTLLDAKRLKKWKISNAPKSSEPAQLSDSVLKIWGIKR